MKDFMFYFSFGLVLLWVGFLGYSLNIPWKVVMLTQIIMTILLFLLALPPSNNNINDIEVLE